MHSPAALGLNRLPVLPARAAQSQLRLRTAPVAHAKAVRFYARLWLGATAAADVRCDPVARSHPPASASAFPHPGAVSWDRRAPIKCNRKRLFVKAKRCTIANVYAPWTASRR